MLNLLESMLQRGSVVCQVRASAVLGIVGQSLSQTCKQAIPGLGNCVHALVQLLSSSNQSLLQQALATTKLLVPLHHQALMSAEISPALVHLLRNGISNCQAAAAAAVDSLAEIPSQAAPVSEALSDSIPFLLDAVRQHRTAIQLPAIRLLASILRCSSANAQIFVKARGPAVIANSFPRCSLAVKQQALVCLSNAADSHADTQPEISEHMLQPALTILATRDDALADHAACLIKHLAASQSAQLCKARAHMQLIAKLESANPDVKLQSLAALCSIMAQQPKIKASISTPPVLSELVKLLQLPFATVQVAAAALLCMLADKHSGRKALLIQAGALAASVQLLQAKGSDVTKKAATLLQTIASGNAELQDQVAECGCIPGLVDTLQGGAAEAAAKALTALSAGHASNQLAVATNSGAIPALAALLRSGSLAEQHAAAQALHSLTEQQPFIIKAAAEAGAPAALVPLVASHTSQLRSQASLAWHMIASSHPVVQRAMQEAGGAHELARGFAEAGLQEGSAMCHRGAAMLRSICCGRKDAADAYGAIRFILRQFMQHQSQVRSYLPEDNGVSNTARHCMILACPREQYVIHLCLLPVASAYMHIDAILHATQLLAFFSLVQLVLVFVER